MTARPEPIGAAGSCVFGFASAHPLAPELERRRFHLLAHQCDHLRLGKSELKFNRLERSAVFPGHFNDSIEIFAGERCQQPTEQEVER